MEENRMDERHPSGLQTGNRLSERKLAWLMLLLSLFLTGCPRNGPKSVVRDRFDYNTAIGNSMKDQMLLNIVKLRYLDVPVFVDVAQIINSYEFQGSASAGASIVGKSGDTLNLGGSGSYSNRPTITYTPLTGNQYVRGLMTPLPPEVVFFTIESGYAADLIIRATVSSINGLHNDTVTDGEQSGGDAGFFRVAALFRLLQRNGAVSLIVKVKPDKERVPVLVFDSRNLTLATEQAVTELKGLLRLNQNANEFRLLFGAHTEADTEISVQTRSLLQMMGALSEQVVVPPEHVAQGVSTKGIAQAQGTLALRRLFRVSSSAKRPPNAYVAVRYRDYWYWVDDSDLESKRVFALLLLFFSFGDTKSVENLPVLTVPVN